MLSVTCAVCGKRFEAVRADAKYCGGTCRSRASRAQLPDRSVSTSFAEMTRQELVRMGKLDSMLGQQVLVLAARMEARSETTAGVVSASKEHTRLMALLRAEPDSGDLVDEVARRRDEKRARASAG